MADGLGVGSLSANIAEKKRRALATGIDEAGSLLAVHPDERRALMERKFQNADLDAPVRDLDRLELAHRIKDLAEYHGQTMTDEDAAGLAKTALQRDVISIGDAWTKAMTFKINQIRGSRMGGAGGVGENRKIIEDLNKTMLGSIDKLRAPYASLGPMGQILGYANVPEDVQAEINKRYAGIAAGYARLAELSTQPGVVAGLRAAGVTPEATPAAPASAFEYVPGSGMPGRPTPKPSTIGGPPLNAPLPATPAPAVPAKGPAQVLLEEATARKRRASGAQP